MSVLGRKLLFTLDLMTVRPFIHVIPFILTLKEYYFCLKLIKEQLGFCHIQLSMSQDALKASIFGD